MKLLLLIALSLPSLVLACQPGEQDVYSECWTTRPDYVALPDSWHPIVSLMQVNATGVLWCGGRPARGCALVLGPYLPCRIIVAAKGLTPAQLRNVIQHEQMHCAGGVHR